jgi:hypothetical protein
MTYKQLVDRFSFFQDLIVCIGKTKLVHLKDKTKERVKVYLLIFWKIFSAVLLAGPGSSKMMVDENLTMWRAIPAS